MHPVPGLDRNGRENGLWFIGDFQGRDPERYMLTDGHVATVRELLHGPRSRLYTRKASAKRAAQRWLERTLDRFAREDAAG